MEGYDSRSYREMLENWDAGRNDKKEEAKTVFTVEEVEKLEAEGWHVVTDSDHFTGGEITK